MKAIRWSDNDRYFGPFTLSVGDYKSLSAVLGSGDGDDYPGCRLRLSAFGVTLISALPPVIKPWRRWVDTSKYAWSDNPAGGYWDTGERAYGFSISGGHLNVSLGRVTNDSETEQRWGCFLPWTQWRHVRFRLYDTDGAIYYEQHGHGGRFGSEAYEAEWRAKDTCPTRVFTFHDFDGEVLTATTKIEESEWRFGEGWFKWLSLFRRPKIKRSLDIGFSGETGKRKGSWKGGTIGHGIEMRHGEMHEAAFRRYCAENSMTFIGPETTQ